MARRNESGLGFGSFIKFREDAIQPETTLGIAVSTFDGVVLTGIAVHLTFDDSVGLRGFSAAQRRAGQADATLFAVELILSGLVDFVSEHGSGIAAELAEIVLHGGNQVAALVEIAPTGLLQEGEAVDDGKVQFLTELSWIGTFSTLDRPDMGLFQTDNTVVAAVGAVVVHFLLLPVHNRDHSQTVPQPAGKQGVCVRNQGRILFQLPGSQQPAKGLSREKMQK